MCREDLSVTMFTVMDFTFIMVFAEADGKVIGFAGEM